MKPKSIYNPSGRAEDVLPAMFVKRDFNLFKQ